MRYLDLGPVLTGRTTDRSHVEFYMTEASSLNSVWAPKKRRDCFRMAQISTAFFCVCKREKNALLNVASSNNI